MKKLKIKTSIIVFLIFFGVAVFEAVRTRNWVNAAILVAPGLILLLIDSMEKGRKEIPVKETSF